MSQFAASLEKFGQEPFVKTHSDRPSVASRTLSAFALWGSEHRGDNQVQVVGVDVGKFRREPAMPALDLPRDLFRCFRGHIAKFTEWCLRSCRALRSVSATRDDE